MVGKKLFNLMADKDSKIIVFEHKNIRRTWYNEEWWFVVEDVVAAITDSKDVKAYVKRMRQRDEELSKGWEQIVTPLPIKTAGGTQKINCANVEGHFRLIQSIRSKKAEPFKKWLAKVGAERIQEIENPELAAERARQLYKEKGYSDEWIETRIKSIGIRNLLTGEWKDRGVQEGIEFAILTSEIQEATFGLKPRDHKEHKSLSKRDNLRDHMTNLELIFTMLGEEGTRTKAIEKDAQGFDKNKEAAQEGGKAAGKAREAYEKETGEEIVSDQNFKQQIRDAKKKLK